MGLLDFGMAQGGQSGQGGMSQQDAGLLALAAGLIKGDIGGGLMGYQQAMNPENELKRGLLSAQIDNYKSEVEQRAEATKKAKSLQDMVGNLFGAGGISAPQVSPGAFTPSLGGMGPTMPPSMADQAQPGSRLANLSIDQIAGLHAAGGPNLLDAYKWVNDPLKMEQGATYKDRATGKERYMPKVGEGIAPDANGFYGELPGYGAAQAGIEGKKTLATKGIETLLSSGAKINLRDNPDGTKSPVAELSENPTIEELIGRLSGGPSTAPRQSAPAAQAAPTARTGLVNQGGGSLSPELQQFIALDAAKNGITNPTVNMTGGSPTATYGLAGASASAPANEPAPGGAPRYGMTTEQQAAAKATEAKAVKTAEADVVRDTTNLSDSKRFNQMQASINSAIDLLGKGPTGSGFGRAIDSAAGFIGKSTEGAELAQRLKVLSGWLTSNVPRMEGPQSDRDVIQYQQMAGMVGDETMPVARRLAAAKEVQALQDKYADLNGYKRSELNATPLPSNPTADALQKGQVYKLPNGKNAVWDGMRFKAQ